MSFEVRNRLTVSISKDLMRFLLYSTMCSEPKDDSPCVNDRTHKLLDLRICSFIFQKCKIFQHSNSASIKQTIRTLYQILLLLILLTVPCSCDHTWEAPGCHRVGEYHISLKPMFLHLNIDILTLLRFLCSLFRIIAVYIDIIETFVIL